MKKFLRNRKGMTLIEVIIAMGLLGIFTIMVLTVFTSVAFTIGQTRVRAIENYEIQGVLESSAADDLTDATTTNYTMTINFDSGTGTVNMVVPGKNIEADSYSGEGRIQMFLPD